MFFVKFIISVWCWRRPRAAVMPPLLSADATLAHEAVRNQHWGELWSYLEEGHAACGHAGTLNLATGECAWPTAYRARRQWAWSGLPGPLPPSPPLHLTICRTDRELRRRS